MVTRSGLLAALIIVLAAQLARGGAPCFDPLCYDCDEATNQCTSCMDGYFLDEFGYCSPCHDRARCAKCSGPEPQQCMKCYPSLYDQPSARLYLDAAGTCQICPKGTSSGPCKKTCSRQGKYMTADGECKACPDKLCKRCADGSGICLECLESKYGDGEFPDFAVYMDPQGTCRGCRQHPWRSGCRACSSDGTCSKCDAGYALKDGTCVPCIDELCAECPDAPDVCKRCMERPPWSWDDYIWGPVYEDRNGRCRECEHLQVNGCAACNQAGECTECTLGFLKNGKCVPCDAYTDDCIECSADGKTCTECTYGFGLAPDGQCVPCQGAPLCADCVNADTCTTCDPWVAHLDAGSKCQQKPPGAERVRADGTVYACEDGYRMVEGKTGPKCLKCSNYGNCIAASYGCKSLDPSGQHCLDGCQYMSGLDKACNPCKDPLCESCDESADKCTMCRSYFSEQWVEDDFSVFMNKEGKCRACQRGCDQCRPDSSCKYCASGWVNVDGTCEKCTARYCVECSKRDRSVCKSCDWEGPNGEPVYLEGGECKLGVKVKGCNWYSDKNGKCKECAYGYTRVGSTCVVD